MAEKTYTPDAKGVAQWLKDNPTKKNKRGRNVRTGLRDGYKAVGYEGPPLKIKEGNLTNNRNRIRLSLRGDAGDAARSAAARPFTKEEFIEFGRRNGYTTDQSTEIFNRFVKRNRAQKLSILPGQHNDHVTPNSAQFYQAGENYRNRVGLSTKLNTFKTNKMPTPSEMRDVGIPTTRSSLIQKEFANAPKPNPKALRNLASKVARDTTRPRATAETQRLNNAQQRRNTLRISGLSNVLGGGSGSDIVDRVNANMHLIAPQLAELGFELF